MLKKTGILTKTFILLAVILSIASCASSGKKKNQQNAEVEKLQNNTEYSAVESEWNEMYQ